jgi:GWxTD domain-containing protein
MRTSALVLLIALLTAPSASAAPSPRAPTTDARVAEAEGLLHRNTIESRRLAISLLEDVTLLHPADAGAQLLLARVYYQAGFLKQARLRFEKVARLDPRDAPSQFGLGQVWRRDWMKYLDTLSLQRSITHFAEAGRLAPRSPDAWLMITPLLVENFDLPAAAEAAERAFAAAPEQPECELAVAYTSFRAGRIERAERAFRHAIPRLPRTARERFEDIAPVASERDTFTLHRLPPAEQPGFIAAFWRENDPDPTSPENEAQLEYWTRVAHAFFLYYNTRRREWDERGEVYVRYGPPARAEYNPVMTDLSWRFGTGGEFPMNVLEWSYPELGMTVQMQDRLLSEYYLLPITRTYDPDPRPQPDSLAAHGDALASAGGRGVFPVLPPGVTRLPVDGTVALFQGGAGARLLAQIETAGGPRDTLTAQWVVTDSAGAEVAREHHALSPSACDPADRRVAEFDATLSPGRYLVGLSVRGPGGRRGVYRDTVRVAPPSPELALSDVVIACGAPDRGAGDVVRIAANPRARVGPGEPLTAYFELYHLTPGDDRVSRFEYVYTVTSADRDWRIWLQRVFAPRSAPAPIQITREESFAGDVRRQFVTVPVQELPPGRYRLEIRVRDLVSGDEAVGRARFTREAATAPAVERPQAGGAVGR